MSTITVDTRISAPLERVFDRFSDLEGAADHMSNIKKIELLTPGAFELGSRWIETRTLMGMADSAEMEVTAYDRNRGYTITHHKAGTRIDTAFTFESVDGQTRVGIDFVTKGHGLPPGLLAPVEWAGSSTVRDLLAKDLSDLKAWIELPQA